jgi:hypothetical protein
MEEGFFCPLQKNSKFDMFTLNFVMRKKSAVACPKSWIPYARRHDFLSSKGYMPVLPKKGKRAGGDTLKGKGFFLALPSA